MIRRPWRRRSTTQPAPAQPAPPRWVRRAGPPLYTATRAATGVHPRRPVYDVTPLAVHLDILAAPLRLGGAR